MLIPGTTCIAQTCGGEVCGQKITSLDAAQGKCFWIGYIDPAWNGPLTPREIFAKRGYETELELNAKDRFQSVTLFRMQCSQKSP
jgi:hypothetical protein